MKKKSDADDSHNKSKQACAKCGKTAKNNSACSRCKAVHCFVHSTMLERDSQERICDECLEEHLIDQLPDKDTAVEAIRNEIQGIVEQREASTQQLCKLSACHMNQKEKISFKEKEYAEKEERLAERIKELKMMIKSNEEDINMKEKSLEKGKQELKFTEVKLMENEKQLAVIAEENKIMTRERNVVLGELNELREFVKMHVPIRLIKRIVCQNCYHRELAEYNKMFKPESAGTEIRRSSVSQPKPKTGACNSCSAF